MNENIAKLRTESDRAQDYRNELRPLLEQACEIITRARREGMIIGFNLAPDAFGIQRVGNIDVTKPL